MILYVHNLKRERQTERERERERQRRGNDVGVLQVGMVANQNRGFDGCEKGFGGLAHIRDLP